MKSPVITLAELNTVYKDLIDRINVASVYNFKGEINITKMLNTDTESDIVIGDIYEIHDILTKNDIDIANTLNLQEHDNIACKKALTKGTKLSLNPDENNYWGNYWTEIGSYMQLADADHNGFVSTSGQTFSGDKEFLNKVTVGDTLIVQGNGTVSTGILNITGGSSVAETLTTDVLKVNGTATVQNIEGPNTTINVNTGGITTVNTIDGIESGDNKDYADFKVNGTVTCRDFNLSSSNLTLNSNTTVNSIQHESCVLKPSGDVNCTDFIATNCSITANNDNSTIKQINNSEAILNSSGTVSCINFDASNMSIFAQGANSTISNINTTTGVLNVLGDSIKCSIFDASGQMIEAKQDTSVIKNISSTTATLNGVSSVICDTLDLGAHQLTVNNNTTFSSILNSPSLSITGTLTCGNVNLKGTDNSYKPLTVNSETTFSSISKISGNIDPTLNTSSSITCGNFNNGSYSITTYNDLTFSSINNIDSSTGNPSINSILNSTGTISCTNFNLSSSSITSPMSTSITFNSIGNANTLAASGTISCKDFNNTSGTVKNTNTGDTTFSNITGSGILDVSGTLYCGNLYASSGTGTVRVPKVEMGNGSSSVPMSYVSASASDENTKKYANSILIGTEGATGQNRGDLIVNGHIFADKVHNAVWNDLVDCIPVNEDVQLEYGYCYSFDGEKYHKSNKHCDSQFIGIHSDTSGMRMGERPCKTLDVAISGFILAYVDHYKSGTPLVCGKNGRLEKATLFDKIFKPYRIIATYWKDETEEEYGPKSSKIKVNGRNWVKIR